MRRLRLLPFFLGATLLPLVATMVASRFYWGYWSQPPAASATAALIRKVERFTSNWPPGPARSGASALTTCAAEADYTTGENPLGRLAAALVRRGLIPATDQPVDSSLLPRIREALFEQGLLRTGEAGYPNATDLAGHIITGTSGTGETVVLAALRGGQLCNDHYPYYEVVLSLHANGTLALKRVQSYRFDIAGIEGAFGPDTAIRLTSLWGGILGATFGFYVVGKTAWRVVRAGAA